MSAFSNSTWARKLVLFSSILFWGIFIQAMTIHWLEDRPYDNDVAEADIPAPSSYQEAPPSSYIEIRPSRSVVFVQVTEIRNDEESSHLSVMIQQQE